MDITNIKRKRILKEQGLLWLLLLPSLLGFTIFFIAPFGASFYYAVINNVIQAEFVGFGNFVSVLKNFSFNLALRNTLLFMAFAVPLNMATAFIMASLVRKAGRLRGLFAMLLTVPLVVPSGAVIFLWRALFGLNGLLNKQLYLLFETAPINWLETRWALAVICVAFIWKNTGFNMILFMAGLDLIPDEYYEYAKIEGAGRLRLFTKITAVYLVPTSFLVFMMSIVNSFKSFREVFGLVGAFPNGRSYMMQQYMNNLFLSFDLPQLTAAAYILAAGLAVIIFVMFRLQKKVGEKLD